MTDNRPLMGPALIAFGLPAIITLPGEDPMTTQGIWLPSIAEQALGVLVQSNVPQAKVALPWEAEDPDPPRGTRIEMARRQGGPVLGWIVESVLSREADEIRLSLIQAES